MLNSRDVLIKDLSQYLNLSESYVARLVNYDPNHTQQEGIPSVPRQWKWMFGHREGTPDEHKYFYATNFLYLFDLANFAEQFSLVKGNANQHMRGRVLDFGCGIGTVAVEMQSLPQVTQTEAVDICIITTDFLRWRSKKYGLNIQVVDPMDNDHNTRSSHLSLKGKYDFIYVRDVLEHAYNRVEIMHTLLDRLADDGVLCEASPIFHYSEDVGKENITLQGYDIWHVLRDRGYALLSEEATGGFSDSTTKCWRKRI